MSEKLRYGDLDLLREHRASIMDSTSLSYGKLMREQLVNMLERVINAAAERDALLAANESMAKDAEAMRRQNEALRAQLARHEKKPGEGLAYSFCDCCGDNIRAPAKFRVGHILCDECYDKWKVVGRSVKRCHADRPLGAAHALAASASAKEGDA